MNDDEITIVGADSIYFGDQQQPTGTGYTPIRPNQARGKLPNSSTSNRGVFVPQYREPANVAQKTTPTTPYVPHVPKVGTTHTTPYTPYVPHVPNVQNSFTNPEFTNDNEHQEATFTSIPDQSYHQQPKQQQNSSPFIPNVNVQNTPFVPVMPLRKGSSNLPNNTTNINVNNQPSDGLNFNKLPEVCDYVIN